MFRHKEENENQHNLTILGAGIRQHSMILCMMYFQNFFTNHASLEYHWVKVIKHTDSGFEVSEAWILILILLLLTVTLTSITRTYLWLSVFSSVQWL